jgi:predicted nucleotidyltransferase
MDLSSPARTVIPTLDAEVLMALVGITMPVTGRQIARLLEAKSHRGVSLVLERLRQQGIVDVVEAGSSNLYSLNRDHVAASAVEALMDLRGKLFQRIRDAISNWVVAPISVAVFGSAARGDGGISSDIDLLIVRPESRFAEEPVWDQQLSDLSFWVHRWSGNRASLIQATPSEIAGMIERGEAIAESLQNDGRYLVGPNILKSPPVRP